MRLHFPLDAVPQLLADATKRGADPGHAAFQAAGNFLRRTLVVILEVQEGAELLGNVLQAVVQGLYFPRIRGRRGLQGVFDGAALGISETIAFLSVIALDLGADLVRRDRPEPPAEAGVASKLCNAAKAKTKVSCVISSTRCGTGSLSATKA